MTNDAPDSPKIEEIFIIVPSAVLQKLIIEFDDHGERQKFLADISCKISLN